MEPIFTPTPYPGTPLKLGSTGAGVKLMQYELDMIRAYLYGSLGFLKVDGIFGSATQATVKQYQTIKGLTADGVIGQNTWNAITADYAAIPDPATPVYPGVPLSYGSSGVPVLAMQTRLNEIKPVYTAINTLTPDGVFGQNTANATRLFQKQFGLNADGIIGERTWTAIVSVHQSTTGGNPPNVLTVYPGTTVKYGSSGDSVRYVQSYMNRVSTENSYGFPVVTVDGQFGANTRALVVAFQRHYSLTADGVVGAATWPLMITEFNKTL